MSLGNVREVTVGRATDKVRELRGELRLNGIDPRATARGDKTFADLFKVWKAEHGVHKKSLGADEGLYDRNIVKVAKLDREPLATLTKDRVISAFSSIARDVTPIQSNRTLTLFKSVCTWGDERQWFAGNKGGNVTLAVKKVATSEKLGGHDRDLTDDELRTLWHGDLPPVHRAVCRLLMLTGQREGEVAGMMKSELRLGGNRVEWEVPASRMKAGLPHIVPLTPLMVSIIKEVADSHPYPFVFRGSHVGKQLHVKTIAHIPNERFGQRRAEGGWSIHDLRRTCKTRWKREPMGRKLGIDDELTKRVQAHSIGGMTGVYDKNDYWDDKLMLLTAWEKVLLDIVGERAEPAMHASQSTEGYWSG